jgi:hypothetical protein
LVKRVPSISVGRTSGLRPRSGLWKNVQTQHAFKGMRLAEDSAIIYA